MISIMCCYNDRKCLESMLLSGLKYQSDKYELLLIDNNKKKYKSAAEAYNKEISKVKGDIIIFLHQDVILDDTQFLAKVINIFEENPNIILGLAGIKKNGKVYSNLRYYKTKEYITTQRVEKNLEEVESIDECFVAIKKNNFDKLKFDEEVCDGWHLYAVELCYAAKTSEMNIKTMVAPLYAYHKMLPGKRVTRDFLKGINKVCEKYKKTEEQIYAPCYILRTGFPKKHLKLLKTYIKLFLKKSV